MLHGIDTEGSAIAEPTCTMKGLIALRIAHENPSGWNQTDCVFLTAEEATTLERELHEIVKVARGMARYAA